MEILHTLFNRLGKDRFDANMIVGSDYCYAAIQRRIMAAGPTEPARNTILITHNQLFYQIWKDVPKLNNNAAKTGTHRGKSKFSLIEALSNHMEGQSRIVKKGKIFS